MSGDREGDSGLAGRATARLPRIGGFRFATLWVPGSDLVVVICAVADTPNEYSALSAPRMPEVSSLRSSWTRGMNSLSVSESRRRKC
jgi:hypothetical protein